MAPKLIRCTASVISPSTSSHSPQGFLQDMHLPLLQQIFIFFYKIVKMLKCQHLTLAKLHFVFWSLVSILCGCRIDCNERSSKAKKTFCNGFTSLLRWKEGGPAGFFATYSKSGQLHQLGRFRFYLITQF